MTKIIVKFKITKSKDYKVSILDAKSKKEVFARFIDTQSNLEEYRNGMIELHTWLNSAAKFNIDTTKARKQLVRFETMFNKKHAAAIKRIIELYEVVKLDFYETEKKRHIVDKFLGIQPKHHDNGNDDVNMMVTSNTSNKHLKGTVDHTSKIIKITPDGSVLSVDRDKGETLIKAGNDTLVKPANKPVGVRDEVPSVTTNNSEVKEVVKRGPGRPRKNG